MTDPKLPLKNRKDHEYTDEMVLALAAFADAHDITHRISWSRLKAMGPRAKEYRALLEQCGGDHKAVEYMLKIYRQNTGVRIRRGDRTCEPRFRMGDKQALSRAVRLSTKASPEATAMDLERGAILAPTPPAQPVSAMTVDGQPANFCRNCGFELRRIATPTWAPKACPECSTPL